LKNGLKKNGRPAPAVSIFALTKTLS